MLQAPPQAPLQSPQLPIAQDKTNELQAALLTLTNSQSQFMTETSSSIRNLEKQVGQLENMLQSRPRGNFPSNLEVNPKEQCNAISLRIWKKLEESIKKSIWILGHYTILAPNVDVENEDKVEEEVIEDLEKKQSPVSYEHHIKIPYPQRLQKKTLAKHFSKFLDIFRKLHINMPFAEALEQISRDTVMTKASCDLGASVNLMPLSIFRKLKLGEALPTTVSLQMADSSVKQPRGVIEDALVKVGKFIFPDDFIILDMEENANIPIILGRPFLAIGRALMDVQKGELKL
ncbi:uncharacterized protein LOC133785827 [Humulus lupulus]|uniref:uncharacterized protein LOC133785827 n=1 Tax=Humulus lupulus TaxID=3486 RepID=UPI002B40F52A|nr:uncharacterized protein LOC133785827 [Humulus lupulus]